MAAVAQRQTIGPIGQARRRARGDESADDARDSASVAVAMGGSGTMLAMVGKMVGPSPGAWLGGGDTASRGCKGYGRTERCA